jgi:hypothetical protein
MISFSFKVGEFGESLGIVGIMGIVGMWGNEWF